MYYSCQNRDHVLGTGFSVSRRMKENIIDFKPLTPRMCKIRLRGIFFNYTIINVHAPTDDKPEEEKDDFYDLLENAYARSPRHDIKIIIGDLNAKVGSSHACSNIGKYSLHSEHSDNGFRLLNLAVGQNMIIGGTFFDHKDIHKGTCISPDGRTVNQIDHVLLDGRHKSDLQDVRVYKSANMDSDHYLVVAKLRARISNNRYEKGVKTVRYNTEILKEEEIKRRFEVVTNEKIRQWRIKCREEQDTENHWLSLKNILVTTGEEIVGLKKRHGRDECLIRSVKRQLNSKTRHTN